MATRRQDTIGVYTVRRPLKRHRAGKKVAPPGIEPTDGLSDCVLMHKHVAMNCSNMVDLQVFIYT